ncbi:MAG: NAD(P)-dependent oxidoreductase [Aerococcus sp.]|nr:NAD(P)-dependent oxidoreductase [Aerococcus sp.]
MDKPIIAISNRIKADQLKEVKDIATAYRVLLDTEIEAKDYPDIEVLYGFNQEILDGILSAETNTFKWLQLETAGTNQVPESLWTNEQVMISTMSGIHATPIMETVYGYLLMFYRGLDIFYQAQQKANWEKYRDLKSLDDKTMLIYGTGHIAQKIAQVAQVMDARVLGVNTTGHAVSGFDETYTQETAHEQLKQVDVIINTMPGTTATEGIFDDTFFQAVKAGSIFINIGRGGAVDEAALLRAIRNGQIAHAGLDVFNEEPLPVDHPFWQEPNIFVTPHISGTVEHFANETYRIFLPNLKAYLETGQPKQNVANKEKRY